MYVIGVTPSADGYSRYIIAPYTEDLEWAQGKVPVPGGYISVRWEKEKNNKSFILTIESPENKTGEVYIPLPDVNYEIAVDGKIAWKNGKAANGFRAEYNKTSVRFKDIKGNHTFAWVSE